MKEEGGGRLDGQPNDTQPNDIQHIGTQHNDIPNNDTLQNSTKLILCIVFQWNSKLLNKCKQLLEH